MNSQCKALGLAAVAATFAVLCAQGPPGMMRTLPVMAALDADADDMLSAEETAAAPAALATLDSDGNGILSPDELVPRFGGRPGGEGGERPEGPGRGGRGAAAGRGAGRGGRRYAAPHPRAGSPRF